MAFYPHWVTYVLNSPIRVNAQIVYTGPRSMTKGFIYFAICDVLGVVKIGYTADPKSRLSVIQTGCPFPVRIAVTIPGNRQEERLIQKTLSQFRIQREWYWLNDSVQKIIDAAKKQTKATK